MYSKDVLSFKNEIPDSNRQIRMETKKTTDIQNAIATVNPSKRKAPDPIESLLQFDLTRFKLE